MHPHHSVHFKSDGRCALVNAIVMHVVSNISDLTVEVGVIPKFRMEPTRFE